MPSINNVIKFAFVVGNTKNCLMMLNTICARFRFFNIWYISHQNHIFLRIAFLKIRNKRAAARYVHPMMIFFHLLPQNVIRYLEWVVHKSHLLKYPNNTFHLITFLYFMFSCISKCIFIWKLFIGIIKKVFKLEIRSTSKVSYTCYVS